MTNPIDVWRAEHAHFARLLDFLDRQISAFNAGRDPDYQLMRDVLYYLRDYADTCHHPRENVAFACLIEHDGALAPAINQLLEEHRLLAQSGATLLEYFEDILADASVIERTVIAAAANLFITDYRQHLTEENKLLPRATQLLTARDWKLVENTISPIRDPLFGDDVGARYVELRQQIVWEAQLQ
jgi:hemerythrin-like domain-containing protein